ncbi:MAG: bifunctional precorrin-2 dehydrogenase/sirohydrochlorin ferrochelatase [Methanosarcinales archaeon]|nr:bifunctional precorrin-2 dehydrogenase/sirohydrochlorin ferrochelatase [Methanosarcinales archaeon]
MVEMKNRKVVIFGGGQVGERKASLFSRYAPTTVISRSFTPGLYELEKQGVNLINTTVTLSDEVILGHIKDVFLVIPTTSDQELNRRIAELAHQSSSLVNSVDGLEDIAVPSIIEKGDITIAISTKGASPALSKYMRQKIEEIIRPEFEDMARILKDIRPKLIQQVPKQEDRSRILWTILEDSDVWEALPESYDKALKIALNHLINGNN